MHIAHALSGSCLHSDSLASLNQLGVSKRAAAACRAMIHRLCIRHLSSIYCTQTNIAARAAWPCDVTEPSFYRTTTGREVLLCFPSRMLRGVPWARRKAFLFLQLIGLQLTASEAGTTRLVLCTAVVSPEALSVRAGKWQQRGAWTASMFVA